MRPAALVEVSAGTPYAARGMHWLIDCYGVESERLADAALLEALLCRAADEAGAHRLFNHFHRFGDAPDAGVTGVVLLAESHITIHTWPEAGFAAIDVFLCGAVDLDRAVACIERGLEPARLVVKREERGAR